MGSVGVGVCCTHKEPTSDPSIHVKSQRCCTDACNPVVGVGVELGEDGSIVGTCWLPV